MDNGAIKPGRRKYEDVDLFVKTSQQFAGGPCSWVGWSVYYWALFCMHWDYGL